MPLVDVAQFLHDRYDEAEDQLQTLLADTEQTQTIIREQQTKLLGTLIPGWTIWPHVETAGKAALAAVCAHKRLVDYLNDNIGMDDHNPRGSHGMTGLLLLAQAYREHPKFQEEWVL